MAMSRGHRDRVPGLLVARVRLMEFPACVSRVAVEAETYRGQVVGGRSQVVEDED